MPPQTPNPLAAGDNHLRWIQSAWPQLAQIAGQEFMANGPGFILLPMTEAYLFTSDSCRCNASYVPVNSPEFAAIRAGLPGELIESVNQYDARREVVLLVLLPGESIVYRAAPEGLISPLAAVALAPLRALFTVVDASKN